MNRPSRRRFLRSTALGAAGLGSAGLTFANPLDEPTPRPRDPEAILAKLLAGNERFVQGKTTSPRRTPADFQAVAESQAPLAVIVGCADSRVAPELVFDQGVGDRFVVRIAGNVISGGGAIVKGSIEYAVAELGVPLIIVLGHGNCGAVKAAIKHLDANDALPGSIGALVETIKPAVADVKGKPGDFLEDAIRANVRRGVARLKEVEPLLAGPAKAGKLKIVGACYDLRTGKTALVE